MTGGGGRWLGRLGVGLAVLVAALVLAVGSVELVLRWRVRRAADAHVEQLLDGGRPTIIDTGPGELGPGVRASPVPNLIYEPRPNLRGVYDGAALATNRLGARHDYALPLAKPAGEFRLVGLGGDRVWGRGVGNGETYLDRLQEKLGRLAPGRAHVLNLGVWGYNASQQVAALAAKGVRFQPDVVTVDLHGDDARAPQRVSRIAYRPPAGSFLLAALRGLAGAGRPTEPAEPEVSYADLERAYDELAALAAAHGFAVVVVSDCLLDESVAALEGHCRLVSEEQWRRWRHRNQTHWGFALCPYNGALIARQPPPWQTPSAEGHRVLADLLYDCLLADPRTHPGLAPTAAIRLPVTDPGVWLRGFVPVAPDRRDAVAVGRGEMALGVRWLEPGERYVVALELGGPTGELRLGFEDGAPAPLSVDPAGRHRSAAPFEVDQAGELRLTLVAEGEVALRAVTLTRAPR